MEHVVHCELCDLPSMSTVERCERCEHRLGTPVDLHQLREDMRYYKRQMIQGIVATAAGLVVAWFMLYAGGAILLLAPIGWAIFGGAKYRARATYLRRLAR